MSKRLGLSLGLLALGLPAAAQNHQQFAEMKLAETGDLMHPQGLDIDVDGDLDVAVLRRKLLSDDVLLALGDGAGNLAAPSFHLVHTLPVDLVFADMDEDGLPDALVANRGSDDVSVLLGDGAGLAAAQHFAAADDPQDLDVGDLDGDGALDLVVACEDAFQLVVLRGDGNGGLSAPGLHSGISRPQRVALADFDEDGTLDAVTTEATGGFHLGMYLGDGSGGFFPPVDLGDQVSPGWLSVVDVREDGHADVVVIGGTADGIQVLFGNGHGLLVKDETVYFPGSNIGSRGVVKDMDFDGHLDFLIGRNDPAEIQIYSGDGSGNFALTQLVLASNARWLDAGDCNGDGHLDLIASGKGQAQLSVLLSDPAGTWRLPVPAPVPAGLTDFNGRIDSADIDGDGLPDLLLSTGDEPKGLHFHRGLGDGSWLRTQVWSEPDPAGVPGALELGDMDVDGQLDVVVTSSVTGRVRVLVGDGAGAFALKDLEQTSSVGLSHVSIGSLNEDGLPDVAITASAPSGKLHLFLGEGGGRIGAAPSLALSSQGADVILTDVTSDDVPDLVVGTYGLANRVVLFKGFGNGSFASPVNQPAGGPLNALVVTDLQPDGAPDVVAALGNTQDSGAVAIFHGNGAGSLLPAVIVDDGDAIFDVAIIDSNGDGLPDLATAGPLYDVVSLLEQDGLGGFLPRRSFGARGAGELQVADANGDGAPDLLFCGDTIGALLNRDGPLSVLGEGLPGTLGVPALAAISDVTGGAAFSLRLQPAPAFAPAVLVVGLSLAAVPLKGGVLVPSPDALIPLATDADGALQIDATWPAGLPSGLHVWMQAWVEDAGAIHGLSASRGLEITTP